MPNAEVEVETKMLDTDKQRMVAALNHILSLELQVIIQYKVQAVLANQPAGVALAGDIEGVALEEMKHAESLMERIDFLGGIPMTQPAPITVGATDVKAIASLDTGAEDTAQKAYTAGIQIAVECNDITTKELLKSILADEEGHAYLFEQITGSATGPSDAPAGTATKGVRMLKTKRPIAKGHINVPFELKSLTKSTDDDGHEVGHIEGYAACYSKDLGDDVIMPGAFKRTLNATKGQIPVLWFHDPMQPVGLGSTAEEDEKGLYVKADLNLDTQVGHDTYSNAKFGIVDCMSIGYEIPKGGAERKDGVRYIKEMALPEYSLLTKGFAMNPDAMVAGVKDFNGELAVQQAEQASQEARWQISDALSKVICELMEDDDDEDDTLSDEEKVGLLRASLAQYTEAMCAWLAGALKLDAQEDAAENVGVPSTGMMARDLSELAVKVGRRNSATDADTIQKAIDLLKSVLANEAPAEDDSPEKSLVDDGSHSDDRESTAAVRDMAARDMAARLTAGLVRR